MRKMLLHLLKGTNGLISESLLPYYDETPGRYASSKWRIRSAAACAIIFAVALGVKALHWQDSNVDIERGNTLLTTLVPAYRNEARRMVDERRVLFPPAQDRSDARMLVHPPGYSMLMAAMYRGRVDTSSFAMLRFVQVLGDALAAVVVFLIAVQLLPFAAAATSGLLVAISPHFAEYSLWLSPDSLAILPVLLAIYLIVRARKSPRIISIVGAGMLLGMSCWLRSNALLLPFLLAGIIPWLFERRLGWRYSGAFIAAALVVISPITIRNWLVYQSFIPLSLGAGITLIEGIAEYDDENRFGLPVDDKAGALKDAEWHSRDDYAGNLWSPDGVERDQARFARGLAVITSNPGWFFSVMLSRAGAMLRYNDSAGHGWSYHIASTEIVGSEPSFGSAPFITTEMQSVWASDPVEIVKNGMALGQAAISLSTDGDGVLIKGDNSDFGDQFALPIGVEKNTDYIAALSMEPNQNPVAIKITSLDRRISLAAETTAGTSRKARRRAKKHAKDGNETDSADKEPLNRVEVPFASNDRDEVLLVLSNNQINSASTMAKIGRVDLFKVGPTPYQWTEIPRRIVRALQKNTFVTGRMLPAIALGLLVLALAGRGSALVLLMVVPIYYLSVQSIFHTEYRYILAVHYFLFIAAAVSLHCVALVVAELVRRNHKILDGAKKLYRSQVGKSDG